MTPRAFCQPETANQFKGAVHGLMLVGATACALYNVAAYCYRKERHSLINGIVYGLLIALEYEHVKGHLRQGAS